jgi:GT2 family glycosyltransferase
MPRVTIIIVNYNAGLSLARAVASVLVVSQVDRVIIVDNASTDQSMEALHTAAFDKPRIVCIQNKDNLGFACACNMGIQAATGDYLLFLNPDCEVQAGALEKLIDAIETNERVGMAGPLLLNPDGKEQAGGRRAVPTPWRSFVRAFGLSKYRDRYPKLFSDFQLQEETLPDGPVEMEAISGSCMLVRRDAIVDVGFLDEGYFMHCEDLDWCMRFRQKGWKIMFVPDARVVHQKGVCSKARPIFVEWHKHKGMIRFYRKFFRQQYPGALLWIVEVGVWFRFSAVALRYSVRSIRSWLADDRL